MSQIKVNKPLLSKRDGIIEKTSTVSVIVISVGKKSFPEEGIRKIHQKT